MGIIVAGGDKLDALRRLWALGSPRQGAAFELDNYQVGDFYNNLQMASSLLNAVKCMTSVMLRRKAHFDAVSHTKNRWNEFRGIHRIVEKLEVIDARSIPWVAVWRPCRCRPFNGDDVL